MHGDLIGEQASKASGHRIEADAGNALAIDEGRDLDGDEVGQLFDQPVVGNIDCGLFVAAIGENGLREFYACFASRAPSLT